MKKKLLAVIIMLSLAVSIIGSTAFAYAELNVTVDGISMVLNSEYDASIIPDGFYEVAHEYNGETYYGGTNDVTDLYFIRCDSDARRTGWYILENGNFVLYQNLDGETSIGGGSSNGGSAETAEAPSTATLTGSSIYSQAIQLQIATPAVGTEIPSGYVETTVAADNAYVTAYQKEDATGASAEAYLVYGTVDGYSFAWYIYDQPQETIQRFMNNAEAQVVDQQEDIIDDLKQELSDLNTKYNNDIGRSKNLFIIACIFAVLFLFLMINAMIKRKHTEKDLEDRIVDLKENRGEETQVFTKSEKRRFDRMDAAARDRADRHYDRHVSDDAYRYPGYGENRGIEASGNRNPEDRMPETQIPAGKAPVGKTPAARPANRSPRDEEEFYLDDGKDANRDNDDMRMIQDDYEYERPVRKEPERNPGYDSRYEEQSVRKESSYKADDMFEERPVRKESSYKADDTFGERPVRKEYAPDRRTYTSEADIEDQLQDSAARTVRRGSVFTSVAEDTTDMGKALKQARSDYNVPGASGETRDFDLDLLEKNLGRMTSEVMDKKESDSKVGRSPVFDSEQSRYSEGRSATTGRSTRFGSVDVAEISDDSDFNTDFIEL